MKLKAFASKVLGMIRGITVNVFPGVKGWFFHMGNVIFKPTFIRDSTVIILAREIQALPQLLKERKVSMIEAERITAILKQKIQRAAIEQGVESYLHRTIKKRVERTSYQ